MKTKLIRLAVMISVIICITMSLLLIASAKSNGTCGDNLIWTFDDNDGTLTISGNGAMTDYSKDSETPWYSYQSQIKQLIIGENVTHIGSYSFQRCSNLTSVTIPDSVVSSGRNVFDRCYKLTSVNIGSGLNEISTAMFIHCQALESIIIPDTITNVNAHAFYGCTELKNVTIGSSVSQIEDFAFYMCGNLGSITIPGSVETIGGAAFAYTGLKSITIPDSVETIGEFAFGYCSNLTEIELSDNISLDNDVFYNCAYYLNTSNWTNNVLYIDKYLIKADTSLSGVYSIKSGTVAISDDAFSGCTSLTGIVIPKSVTIIGNNAFANTGLNSITIPESVTTIGEGAFYNCSSLESIDIPDSVAFIGKSAFDSCKSLRSIDIPDSITAILDRTFLSCKNLTEIIIPDSVETIGNTAFTLCTSLNNITLTNNVKTIGDGAFADCSALSNVYYKGSEEDWESISIGTNNTYLTNATIHYLKEVVVSYNLNGGDGIIESVTVLSGTNVTLEDIPCERNGYSFLGWATTVSATEAEYQPGGIVTVGSDDLILYAVWYKIPYTSTKIISGNGYKLYNVSLYEIPDGSTVIIACYNKDILAYTESRSTDDTVFAVLNTVEYDEVKIFVWNTFENMCPVTRSENVMLTSSIK